MNRTLKIAIIGDFNFSHNAHHATNFAIEHAATQIGVSVNYYWLRLHEMTTIKQNNLNVFDAFWIAHSHFYHGVCTFKSIYSAHSGT